MLNKLVKSTIILALTTTVLSATNFNAGAEKDRLEMIKFFEAKFDDPAKNKDRFFTYFTEEELEQKYDKNLKHMDFNIGSYAYSKDARSQYEALKEMPPYEDAIEKGEVLYTKKFANGNSLQSCFPDLTNAGTYPYYDTKTKKMVSLTSTINDCLRANGEKEWGTKKGPMAEFQAYWVNESKEAGKNFDIKINSKAEKEAYERGKEYYYTQRGYLKLSCATCHVQGSGQRVRNEVLSPLLGQVTHFPVLRLKWTDIGTVERRLSGCVVDQGQVPPKDESQTMIELLYFLAYMSNGMPVDGPDVRK
ncbi:sulfur oxidation c-type cytochrome SoxA [Aliarcobacter trophiarum LMG 25534]|uniref:SoxAX cytochrome complex subunit A n=1 Tax=Aliarcobacter trophiarum LMG 25534 TaxID=1032241 RepID=A0AAD0VM70_9BACT|nr:sulfur oxidation c-type cytochrome SoxA [Aliarcobacter trophiarum]AXK48992.1 sulfur oxidation protein SoxXA, diheme cytochrome c subunit [Aliarcobacter trophiarum LMG 25534]RXI24829.1 sulfur oxidation c-type cytochrome SoxA [Aliarcobacter trophiarum]RXJ92722.1 sulfur oxidation c-type cytochrome SoxA [Aliarcobacter trophiarum LMG 25534]